MPCVAALDRWIIVLRLKSTAEISNDEFPKSKPSCARPRTSLMLGWFADCALEEDGFEPSRFPLAALSQTRPNSFATALTDAFLSTEITCRLQRSERAELVGAQADRGRCEILLEMRYRGSPRNGQHGGGAPQ